MCSFEMTVGPCVSHRAWLLCPLHHSLSPQCFLHLPLCSANHKLPCLTRDIANYIHQLHSSEYRSVSAMIPCYFTVPNMSKLSSPVTPQIQSCFPRILATLDCSSAASAPLCYFKSQQRSWFRTPGLINIETINVPSLGTDWHGLSPSEIR